MRRCAPIVVVCLALPVAACGQSMDLQPRNRTYSPSPIFPDDASARPLPANTVARGDLARDHLAANPPPVTAALLQRGRERFDRYCSPCHGLAGRGDGMIVKRGFPAPPDYNNPRLRAASAVHILDVITNGYGVMYSYRARVEPQDRWAIVSYIRALQASASVPADKILTPGEPRP